MKSYYFNLKTGTFCLGDNIKDEIGGRPCISNCKGFDKFLKVAFPLLPPDIDGDIVTFDMKADTVLIRSFGDFGYIYKIYSEHGAVTLEEAWNYVKDSVKWMRDRILDLRNEGVDILTMIEEQNKEREYKNGESN